MFDKHSGNLVGYTDLGDPMTNFACLPEEDPIANVTSYQLMPFFWKVVSTLELTLNFWVIGLVNNGASPNQTGSCLIYM